MYIYEREKESGDLQFPCGSDGVVGHEVHGDHVQPALIHRQAREYHTVGFEGFFASDIRGSRDQVCTPFGPKVNCVR